MVEHAAVNRRVVGSSPTRGAKKKEVLVESASFFLLHERVLPGLSEGRAVNAAVIPTSRDAGSSPVFGAKEKQTYKKASAFFMWTLFSDFLICHNFDFDCRRGFASCVRLC